MRHLKGPAAAFLTSAFPSLAEHYKLMCCLQGDSWYLIVPSQDPSFIKHLLESLQGGVRLENLGERCRAVEADAVRAHSTTYSISTKVDVNHEY